MGLVYRHSLLHLNAFVDADWAGSSHDRRSTTGYCIYFGSNPISLSTKNQHTVARSSMEAEYWSLAHTAAEMCWLTYLLSGLHIPQLLPLTVQFKYTSHRHNSVFHAKLSLYSRTTSQTPRSLVAPYQGSHSRCIH